MNKLNRKFFERNPVDVAQDLLGCYFLHKTEKGIIRGKIIETEAYGDANDLASHARFGSSIRNRIMFGKAGILYVYHIYGIFYLTNIICEKEGTPGAVLIRSVEVTEGKDLAITNLESSKFVKINEQIATGPGKFSMAFGIGKKDNGKDIT
jgi:DNA-3-methyladenine glycosylase